MVLLYYSTMSTNKNDKRNALIAIGVALLLQVWSRSLVTNTYAYKTYHAYEGVGLLVGLLGVIFWVYGFITYARAKKRSDLLGLLLSFFSILGLVILLLLKDLNKKKHNGN